MCRFLCVQKIINALFLPVLSGVPQGSRPMLYLIFMNDLSRSIKYFHTLMVADYIKCILPIAILPGQH